VTRWSGRNRPPGRGLVGREKLPEKAVTQSHVTATASCEPFVTWLATGKADGGVSMPITEAVCGLGGRSVDLCREIEETVLDLLWLGQNALGLGGPTPHW